MPPPPPPLPLDQTQAPTPLKTPPSPPGYTTYRIHLINWCISFHSCQILSPSKTGFTVPAHRLTNINLLTLLATLRDRSITHILQGWISTKSSISQLECIFIFIVYVDHIPGIDAEKFRTRQKICKYRVPLVHILFRRYLLGVYLSGIIFLVCFIL